MYFEKSVVGLKASLYLIDSANFGGWTLEIQSQRPLPCEAPGRTVSVYHPWSMINNQSELPVDVSFEGVVIYKSRNEIMGAPQGIDCV